MRNQTGIPNYAEVFGKAFCSAFEQVLLLASEAGLLKVGMVSVDGTKVKANASKIKSVRYDRIIAVLMEQVEAADKADEEDGLSLPQEIARRESLKTKLDATPRRLLQSVTDPDSAIMRKSARHKYTQAYNAQAKRRC